MPSRPRWRGAPLVRGRCAVRLRGWAPNCRRSSCGQSTRLVSGRQSVRLRRSAPRWLRGLVGLGSPLIRGRYWFDASRSPQLWKVAARGGQPVLNTGPAPKGPRVRLLHFPPSMEAWPSGYGTPFEAGHSLRGSQVRVLPLPPKAWRVAGYGWPGQFAKLVSPSRAMRVRIPCPPPDRA